MTFQQEVHSATLENSLVFLNKAIEELAGHDDGLDAPLEQSVATLATAMAQTAFELALVAYAIREYGISKILKAKDRLRSPDEIRELFSRNELKTVGFDDLLADVGPSLFTEDEREQIQTFQRFRNKLLHLAHPFSEGDRYDLKYELIHFTCSMLVRLIAKSDDDLTAAQVIAEHIKTESFKKLVRFPPFIYEIQRQAGMESEVITCIHCEHRTLAKEELICYLCSWEYEAEGFTNCSRCSGNGTLIYDHLNIHLNENVMPALCLKCGESDSVYQCPRCENSCSIEEIFIENTCRKGYCKFFSE